MLVPPALHPGDRVRVIAPSGPFDRTLVWRGMGWLQGRYRVSFSGRMFERRGYLAGSDESRLEELNDALACAATRAIVAARGGYGLARIVAGAHLDALQARPKWIVGFSDITALHAEANVAGLASLHAHNMAGMGRGDAAARAEWLAALEAPLRTRTFVDLACWHPGRTRGRIIGGNLTVLAASIAAGRLRLPDGAVLLLEDVGEAPYRIDRMLTSLRLSGALSRVGGVVLGDFTDCEPGRHGVTAEAVLRELLGLLGVPVAAGLRSGHGRYNVPIHLGYDALLDASAGRLVLEAPAD